MRRCGRAEEAVGERGGQGAESSPQPSSRGAHLLSEGRPRIARSPTARAVLSQGAACPYQKLFRWCAKVVTQPWWHFCSHFF